MSKSVEVRSSALVLLGPEALVEALAQLRNDPTRTAPVDLDVIIRLITSHCQIVTVNSYVSKEMLDNVAVGAERLLADVEADNTAKLAKELISALDVKHVRTADGPIASFFDEVNEQTDRSQA